jgi:hypothetical protein
MSKRKILTRREAALDAKLSATDPRGAIDIIRREILDTYLDRVRGVLTSDQECDERRDAIYRLIYRHLF